MRRVRDGYAENRETMEKIKTLRNRLKNIGNQIIDLPIYMSEASQPMADICVDLDEIDEKLEYLFYLLRDL